jgi:hypothetical protein
MIVTTLSGCAMGDPLRSPIIKTRTGGGLLWEEATRCGEPVKLWGASPRTVDGLLVGRIARCGAGHGEPVPYAPPVRRHFPPSTGSPSPTPCASPRKSPNPNTPVGAFSSEAIHEATVAAGGTGLEAGPLREQQMIGNPTPRWVCLGEAVVCRAPARDLHQSRYSDSLTRDARVGTIRQPNT